MQTSCVDVCWRCIVGSAKIPKISIDKADPLSKTRLLKETQQMVSLQMRLALFENSESAKPLDQGVNTQSQRDGNETRVALQRVGNTLGLDVGRKAQGKRYIWNG